MMDLISQLSHVLLDAYRRATEIERERGNIRRDQELNSGYLEVYSWPQTWADGTCGFGGIGGQVITTAQTVCVMDDLHGYALVYHAGRHAYTVHLIDYTGEGRDIFWRCVMGHDLPGAVGGKPWAGHRRKEEAT